MGCRNLLSVCRVKCAGRVAELGPRVAAALAGQGGGRPGLFQGKASRLDRAADAFVLLQS